MSKEKLFKDMTYEEFRDFFNRRCCDGRWSKQDAIGCITIIEHIEAIKIKTFGFYNKKKTEQAREKEWKKFVWK